MESKVLTKRVNNNGISEKGAYGYLNRTNRSQRYYEGKNTSCWGYVLNHSMGIHSMDYSSKYQVVRRIQNKRRA